MAAAGVRSADFIKGWTRRAEPLDVGFVDEASMLDDRQFADLQDIFPTLVLFGDPAQLKALEAITHPAIRQRVADWRAAQTAPYCIYSAAILIEAGMTALVDRVLLVDAPEAVQLRRLTARDAASETLARQMIAAQASRERRLDAAHDVIDNRDDTQAVEAQVARLHRMFIRLAESV